MKRVHICTKEGGTASYMLVPFDRKVERDGLFCFYIIGKCFAFSYDIKTLRGDAHDAHRKAAKAATHRRSKCASPS